MLSLKEFACKYVNESILDDIDVQIKNSDKIIDMKRAQAWGEKSRKKPWIAIQKQGYALGGDFVIDDIETEIYYGLPIKRVDGNIAIKDCNIESLEGLFLPGCTISGTLAIEDCPNLKSLNGLPAEIGTLVVNYNKSLKTIEIDNREKPVMINNNMYLSKNGKRFKKDVISNNNNILVIKNIFCSIESNVDSINEDTVNEAFKAPQLKILADALKKAGSKNRELAPKIKQFVSDVRLDTISSKDVYEYSCDDPEAAKNVRMYYGNKRRGFFFVLDSNGDACIVFEGERLLRIKDYERYHHWQIDKYTYMDHDKVSEMVRLVKMFDTVVFVDCYNYDSAWATVGAPRRHAKHGAIALMKGDERTTGDVTAKQVRYYQKIANDNRERYKKLITKLKVEKHIKANKFSTFKSKIDSLYDRYTALLEKMLKAPEKYNKYDLSDLNSYLCASSNRFGAPRYSLADKLYDYFSMLQDSKDDFYLRHSDKDTITNIINIENKISDLITIIDQKLTALEKM